jgi:hypothetical protein
MFMQSGQYHSAAEVLGALYSAAVTLLSDELRSADKMLSEFGKLLNSFRDNPELFFPMEKEDIEAFREKAPGAIAKLQMQHMCNIRERLLEVGDS